MASGDDFASLYQSAMECHRRGDDERAITLLAKSLELQPMHFEATFNLGAWLFREGRMGAARKQFDRAVLIKPGNREALISLAKALMAMNELVAAQQSLKKVLDGDPGDLDAHLALATIEQTLGHPDQVSRHYQQALDHHPGSARVWYAMAMRRRWHCGDAEIARLLAAASTKSLPDEDRILFAYAVGKMYDDLEDYELAMAAYREANQMQARQQRYDYQWQTEFFLRHQQWQSQDLLRNLSAGAVADSTPIFVIGMPRSGTSLVEQILASHPQVSGAGEIEYTRLLVEACEEHTGQAFPENISAVEPVAMSAATVDYLERLRSCVAPHPGSKGRVVDKLPHNFLRVGVLATMMPQASFVLCERHPMDVCLSIYRQHFSDTHGYACDLVELGRYYRLYQNLVDYWDTQFPGRLYRLSYEQLVSDARQQISDLLSHLGLPFDQACLNFHENRRLVTTPSASQVRRPLYSGGIGHWRRYAAWLEPLQGELLKRRT